MICFQLECQEYNPQSIQTKSSLTFDRQPGQKGSVMLHQAVPREDSVTWFNMVEETPGGEDQEAATAAW